MIKTVLLMSREYWNVSEAALGLPRGARVLRFEGDLAAQVAKAVNVKPDAVLVGHFAPDALLLAHLKTLCRELPDAAIVPVCENPESIFLIEAMRTGVAEVLPTDAAHSLRDALARLNARISTERLRSGGERAEVLGLMSAKGGDGAGCLAANLAHALTLDNPGARVLLIDMALPFGDVEMYLTSGKIEHDLGDLATESDRLDPALLDSLAHHLSDSLHLIPAPLVLDKVVKIMPSHIAKMIDVAALSYQHVLINLDASLDQLTLAALDKIDRLVLVTTLTMPSVRRASQIMNLWSSLGYSAANLSILVNRVDSKTALTPNELEKAIGAKIERLCPNEPAGVQESLLKGASTVQLAPRSAFSKSIISWARDIRGEPEQGTSLWHRFGIR